MNEKYKSVSVMNSIIDRISSNLNEKEVKLLTVLSGTVLDDKTIRKVKTARDLFLALANGGYFDESNFTSLFELLRAVKRHDLFHLVHLQGKTEATLDPVEEYLKHSHVPHIKEDPEDDLPSVRQALWISGNSASGNSSRTVAVNNSSNEQPNKRLRRSQRIVCNNSNTDSASRCVSMTALKKKYTCDVRLRVRAEYCNYQTVLLGNVSSFKPDPVERELECFSQASAILRARDLGYIVCDIKFSEITYLDAFWRDYLNGSLLEALKGVFITDSLKQAFGNEAIKLLVNVEESDYEKGRSILIQNLHL
ncbi:death effector domain-containing protein-like [Uloborus diversus]|uniref:death effector domain-containing protein-like n=1 Tax=Uloborus diversus TaxID=327109 RepID=UPI002409FFA9|nr:death effector domain-containing protein-like [Uloborus diversus]